MTDEENKNPDEEWDYEYEYVEIPEGEDLPQGDGEYEYQYVEVPVEDAVQNVEAVEAGVPVSLSEEVDITELSPTIMSSEVINEEIELDDLISGEAKIDLFEGIKAEEPELASPELVSLENIFEEPLQVAEASVVTIPEPQEVQTFENEEPSDDEVLLAESAFEDIFDDSDTEPTLAYPIETTETPLEPAEPETDEKTLVDFAKPLILEEETASLPDVDEEPDLVTVEAGSKSIEADSLAEGEDFSWQTFLKAKITVASASSYPHAKRFGKSGTVELFRGTSLDNTILLEGVVPDELAAWKIILFDKKALNLDETTKNLKVPMPANSVRYAKLLKNGEEKLAFYNDEEFNFINPEDVGLYEGKFVVADTHETTLMVHDFITLPADEFFGKQIEFEENISGMLVGPNASILYFSGVKALIIPEENAVPTKEEERMDESLKWYNGTASDKYFNLSPNSQSSEIVGTDEINSIYVQLGTTTYGWNVSFDNGNHMSVKDLTVFECRNGRMPSENGTITYGAKRFVFKNIKRIVLYEIPQYLSY